MYLGNMAYKPLQFREFAEKVDSNVFARDDGDGSPMRDRSLFLDESNRAVFAAADV